jgi:hypothetical protein
MTNKRIFFTLAVQIALLPWAVNAAPPAACHTGAPTDAPAVANDAVGQQLIAEERASWDLAIQRNAASYKAFHAPDFFTLTGSGVVERAPSEASAMDSNVRFEQCELSGFDVHYVAKDAALITYHVKAAGLDHGKGFQLDSYASSLWMKRDGKWLNVFYQATPTSNR